MECLEIPKITFQRDKNNKLLIFTVCKNKHDNMKLVNIFNKENKFSKIDNSKFEILDDFILDS